MYMHVQFSAAADNALSGMINSDLLLLLLHLILSLRGENGIFNASVESEVFTVWIAYNSSSKPVTA
jgi:hypothetical protein